VNAPAQLLVKGGFDSPEQDRTKKDRCQLTTDDKDQLAQLAVCPSQQLFGACLI